jgi:excisionase family DNA binding protein
VYDTLQAALTAFEAMPTRESAASQLGVSGRTVVNWIRRGRLKEYRLGHGQGSVTRIDQKSIDSLLAERQ